MVLLLWGWRVGAWGLGLPARSASVCGLLLFERAKSVLRGSAMCEVEGGGAAAAAEEKWGKTLTEVGIKRRKSEVRHCYNTKISGF